MSFSWLAERLTEFGWSNKRTPRGNDTDPLYEREVRGSGGEPAEKRLGLLYAFAREEEVNDIGLFCIECADGSDQVVAHD